MNKAGTLKCMPILLSASTVAAASSFEGTSSGLSKVKDLQVPLLPQERAWAMVRDLLDRVPDRPCELPMDCPDKVADVLDWAGGMPRKIAWSLSAMSGSVPVDEEKLPTGGHLVHTCVVSSALFQHNHVFDHHLQDVFMFKQMVWHACASCTTPCR